MGILRKISALFKQQKKESLRLNELIWEIAEHQREEDYLELYERLRRAIVCLPVNKDHAHPAGWKVPVGEASNLKTSVAEVQGLKVVPVFIDPRDQRLIESFVLIDAIEALRMVLRMPEADGLLIQNREISWVAFDTEKIRWILRHLGLEAKQLGT